MKNIRKPDDVGRSLGADGGGLTTEENRGGETARLWERGRQQMRWEDCVKRDVRKAGDDKWRKMAADREKKKEITDNFIFVFSH